MSINTSNDGGPAFPARPTEHLIGGSSITTHHGMSLRDYAAIHMVSYELTVPAAEALLGRPCPGPKDGKGADPIDVITYLADADAAFRYLRADALIRARKP